MKIEIPFIIGWTAGVVMGFPRCHNILGWWIVQISVLVFAFGIIKLVKHLLNKQSKRR